MKEKNNHFNQTNFNPLRLKEFKTENFSIEANHRSNRKNSSVSLINNKYSILVRNPAENFLYNKININRLLKVKFLLEKSVQNENSVSNSTNHISFKRKNIINNKDSNSEECIKSKNFKKLKNYKYKYCKDNYLNNTLRNNYNNKNKKALFRVNNNYNIIQNKFHKRFKDYLEDKNTNISSVIANIKKNKNICQSTKTININYYNLLDKIILIQSFWRSYYLRKLLARGVEKYYSSIAITKYINNIIYIIKKILFHSFIESIKEYILSNKFVRLSDKISKTNINECFNGNDESINSFGIPKDKKKDCIYFFINKEKTKNNNNKNSIKNNGFYENISKSNIINIKDYNWKCCKNCKDNDNITIMHDKKKQNYIKSQNFNKNIYTKINLLKKNNAKNGSLRYLGTDVSFHDNKNKKLINQKLYIKKKFNDSNNNNKSDSNKANYFSYKIVSPLLNTKKKNFIKLNSFMKLIKRKYLHLFFSLFKKNLNSKKINVYKNHKSNSEINMNIIYKKTRNNISEENSKYHKIKVNRNNNIEKSKRTKLLKKILEKKFNENIKKNIISLKKYFFIWNKHNSNKRATSAHSHQNKNLNKVNNLDNLNMNTIQDNLVTEKNRNSSNKKHIKIRYKKSFTSFNTLCSNSFDRKNMSVGFKKMKIIKKLSENYNCISSLSCSSLINNSNYKNKCFNKINKDIFIKKIISLVNKLEFKSKLFKHFRHWKKIKK